MPTIADRTPQILAGIDIGGTKTAALLVDGAGRVLDRGTVPTPSREGGAAMADAAAALLGTLCERQGIVPAAVGLGAAGVIDHRTGTVVAASDTFAGWEGFPIAAELGARLGHRVRAENDVNAFLLGELAWGAARGETDAMGVMLGTGVGGAVVLDGALFHGRNGAACEIGHAPKYSDHVCTCGRVGHLETLASGRSIAKRYAEASGSDSGLAAPAIAERARLGDPVAAGVFSRAGEALALACANAATLFDLSTVVIGGSVTKSWDLLQPAVDATLHAHPLISGATLVIRQAVLGDDAVALGAAADAARSLAPA